MPPFQAGSPIALCATALNLSRLAETAVPLEVSDNEGSRHEIDLSDGPSIVHRDQHGPIGASKRDTAMAHPVCSGALRRLNPGALRETRRSLTLPPYRMSAGPVTIPK